MFRIYPIDYKTDEPRVLFERLNMPLKGSIYLQGEVASMNGYSLGLFDGQAVPEEDGIYDAMAIFSYAKNEPCNLYVWYPTCDGKRLRVVTAINSEFCGYIMHGYVVAKDDVKGNKWAQEQFDLRAQENK